MFINGVKSYSTVYNAKGQVAEIIDLVNDVTTCYTYDISGRPLRSTQSDGKSISTGYDILNRVTSVNYQFAGESYTASYGYGADGQKGTSTLISGDTHTATYDSLGRETASIVGGRLTRGITYWNVGGNKTTTLPQTLSYTQGGSTLLSTAYTYDSRGNIATMTVDGVTWSYTYDSLNQLTGVTTSDNSFTASYSYDNGGNITSKTVNGVTTTYGYNDPNWKDKLTRYGNEGVSSDRIGNIWQIGTYQMSYVGRQLIEVYTAENNTINFYYNADGIRVKKVNEDIGTTNYFVDGSTILAEQTGTDVIWYIYDSNGEIVGFTYNEVPYYYLKNQQGDVYKIVEENGTLAGSYTYDPWGKVLTCTGTIAEINPIRYRSYYYDTETGYYYLQSRYYDPNVGRFISADSYVSTGQGILGHNMYAYCQNNPVMYYDDTGHAIKSNIGYYCDGGSGDTAVEVYTSDGHEISQLYIESMKERNRYAEHDGPMYIDVTYVGTETIKAGKEINTYDIINIGLIPFPTGPTFSVISLFLGYFARQGGLKFNSGEYQKVLVHREYVRFLPHRSDSDYLIFGHYESKETYLMYYDMATGAIQWALQDSDDETPYTTNVPLH